MNVTFGLKTLGFAVYLALCAALIFASDLLSQDDLLFKAATDILGMTLWIFLALTLATALYTLWVIRPSTWQYLTVCVLLFGCLCAFLWLKSQLFPDTPEEMAAPYYGEGKEMLHGFLLFFYAFPYFPIWGVSYLVARMTGWLKRRT